MPISNGGTTEASGFESEWNWYEIRAWPAGICQHLCNNTWPFKREFQFNLDWSLRTPWSLVTFISAKVFHQYITSADMFNKCIKQQVKTKLPTLPIPPNASWSQENWKPWSFSRFKQSQLKPDSQLRCRGSHPLNFPRVQKCNSTEFTKPDLPVIYYVVYW